jgi:hypothetical protein
MRHFVVIARLKPGAAPKALELLHQGPPFDLEGSRLERHGAFVGDDELVFVFEGEHAEEEAARLLQSSSLLEDGGRLAQLIEGQPTLPREVFSWERPPDLEGVIFGPDPGPGDSDGGERD